MDWKNKSKTFTFLILILLILSSIGIGTSSGEEDSEIVAIDNIVEGERIGSFGVNTAVYTGEDTVFFVVDILQSGYRYVKYDFSTYESEKILEKKEGIPFGDPLSAVYTGEDILIFGGQLLEQSQDSDKIYRVDNNGLTELEVTIPVDVSYKEPFYHLNAVWAENEAYLFMESGVYTFDPSDNSFEKHEVEYPENFFIGSSDRSTVYVDGDIYMVSYDKIYRYQTDKHNLEKLGDLPTKHPDLIRRATVYTGDEIYIMGAGELGKDPEITDEIFRFNPESKESELLNTRLPQPMHGCELIHHDGFIYIMGHTVEFDPTSKHAESTNEIYRYNYRGIDAPKDYPGPDHGDDFPWSTVIIGCTVGGIGTVGAVFYFKKRKGNDGG